MPETTADAAAIGRAVRRAVLAESELSIDPDQVRGDEPLDGRLLKVSSMGIVRMLVRLEDELGMVLADDLFVGRSFTTVDDLVAVVAGSRAVRP